MRLFPRVRTELPVTINEKIARSEGTITSLSPGGFFIKGYFHPVRIGDMLYMKYHLPGYGLLEHTGRTTRKSTKGVALHLSNLELAAKIKLWKFIVERLGDLKECPYCGQKIDPLPEVCPNCGWRLEFNSPDYFEYHEKMVLLKKLHLQTEKFSTDEIRKVIQFIEVVILKVGASENFQEILGDSEVMAEVFTKIRKVAPTDVPVLLLGESGTGKELVALSIHERSMRREKAFVPINCAAIPESLLEAELFGYEKGSYTGAFSAKMGKFEYADGGTLFLDEIGELPPSLQVKLLRFLESQIVERIGGIQGKKVNVRFIAATNCNIESAIAAGRFRPDLFYRLEAFTIKLPPVRERGEDRILLARFFLDRFAREMGISKRFTEEAERAMLNYSWPGNVREILNKVRRSLVMSSGNLIRPSDLELDMPLASRDREGTGGFSRRIEKQRLEEVLANCSNNISRSAKLLGVSRPTIYSLKRKFGI